MLMLSAAILCSASVLAQRNSSETMADRQMARMKTELSLTDDQASRLAKANKEFRESHAQIFRDTSLTRQAMMTKGKALAEDRERKIKEILTKEQYDKWMNSKPAVRSGRTDARQGHRSGIHGMKTSLGLSDDQSAQMTRIHAEMMDKFRELRADTTLTREARTKEQKQIMEQRRSSVKKVLTEEQYEKFLAIEKKRIEGRRTSTRDRRR